MPDSTGRQQQPGRKPHRKSGVWRCGGPWPARGLTHACPACLPSTRLPLWHAPCHTWKSLALTHENAELDAMERENVSARLVSRRRTSLATGTANGVHFLHPNCGRASSGPGRDGAGRHRAAVSGLPAGADQDRWRRHQHARGRQGAAQRYSYSFHAGSVSRPPSPQSPAPVRESRRNPRRRSHASRPRPGASGRAIPPA